MKECYDSSFLFCSFRKTVWLDGSDSEVEQIVKFSDGSLLEWIGHSYQGQNFPYSTTSNYQYLSNAVWAMASKYKRYYFICEVPKG